MLIVFLAAVIFGLVAQYTIANTSDSYAFAKHTITTDSDVFKAIGHIEDLWMVPLRFKYSISGDNAQARYQFYVVGKSSSALVSLVLRRDHDKWGVVRKVIKEATFSNFIYRMV